MKGKIVNYNSLRGFGFIEEINDAVLSLRYFFHINNFDGIPANNDIVTFDLADRLYKNEICKQAVNVKHFSDDNNSCSKEQSIVGTIDIQNYLLEIKLLKEQIATHIAELHNKNQTIESLTTDNKRLLDIEKEYIKLINIGKSFNNKSNRFQLLEIDDGIRDTELKEKQVIPSLFKIYIQKWNKESGSVISSTIFLKSKVYLDGLAQGVVHINDKFNNMSMIDAKHYINSRTFDTALPESLIPNPIDEVLICTELVLEELKNRFERCNFTVKVEKVL